MTCTSQLRRPTRSCRGVKLDVRLPCGSHDRCRDDVLALKGCSRLIAPSLRKGSLDEQVPYFPTRLRAILLRNPRLLRHKCERGQVGLLFIPSRTLSAARLLPKLDNLHLHLGHVDEGIQEAREPSHLLSAAPLARPPCDGCWLLLIAGHVCVTQFEGVVSRRSGPPGSALRHPGPPLSRASGSGRWQTKSPNGGEPQGGFGQY